MKKFILLGILVAAFTHSQQSMAYQYPTSSSINYIYPPDVSKDWQFYGNQGIYIYVANCNPQIANILLTWHHSVSETKAFIALPLQRSKEEYYSIFGNVPIFWNFTISTPNGAANVWLHANWASFNA